MSHWICPCGVADGDSLQNVPNLDTVAIYSSHSWVILKLSLEHLRKSMHMSPLPSILTAGCRVVRSVGRLNDRWH